MNLYFVFKKAIIVFIGIFSSFVVTIEPSHHTNSWQKKIAVNIAKESIVSKLLDNFAMEVENQEKE